MKISALSQPIVSIVIPVYNLEGYLAVSLDSVLAQTYRDFEAIVVDDGSTDGTGSLLDEYAQRDARIVAIHKANAGVAKARETALGVARGRYIAFLDGDDSWLPDMLQRMMEAFLADPTLDLVCCDYFRVGRNYRTPARVSAPSHGAMTSIDYLEKMLSNRIWGGLWAKCYRRELFECPINHHPLRLWQDLMVNVQIACRMPKVRFIDYAGYNYLQRGGSSNHRGVDFAYCKTYAETLAQEIRRHSEFLGDRTEFYCLLAEFRAYSTYLAKSRSAWMGDDPFAVSLRTRAWKHRSLLRNYFSIIPCWLLWLDRARWMRIGSWFLLTMRRWGASVRRRWVR